MRKNNQSGFTLIEGLLVLVVILLFIGVSYYVFNANKTKNTDNSSEQKVSTESKQTENKTEAPQLIEYPVAIEIRSKQDIVKLKDASNDFKQYIGSLIGESPKYEDGCENALTIQVKKIYKNQFALGAQGSCGGANIIWKKTGNNWDQALGMQDVPYCSILTEKNIPNVIVSQCYSPDNLLIDNPTR